MIIEIRPGAAQNLGTEAVFKADPDGYTLLVTTSPNTIEIRKPSAIEKRCASRKL